MKTRTHRKGFSLLEMIIYISILSFMLAIIVEVVLSVTRSERIIKSARTVENSAVATLERIGREVRGAEGVDVAQSVFNSHPGVLVVEAEDESGTHEKEFYLSEGKVMMMVDGVESGALTEEDSRVTELKFYRLQDGLGEAIRTELTLESGTSTYYRTVKFYSANSLR
jgi:prepilin-type N-terminal cleavage/methylation domain-containing protein